MGHYRRFLMAFVAGAVPSWDGNLAALTAGDGPTGRGTSPGSETVEECAAPNLLQLKHEVVGAAVRSSAVGSQNASSGAKGPTAIKPFRDISSSGKFCLIGDLLPYWTVLGGNLDVAIACGEPKLEDQLQICEEFQAVAESSCGSTLQKTVCAEKVDGTYVGVMTTDSAQDCSYVAEGPKSLEDYKQLPGSFCEQTTSQAGCEDACSSAPYCAGYAYLARTSHCVLSMSGACPAGLQELELLQNAASGQASPNACAPYSAEACRRAATAAGLELGGEGFAFEGSFTTKGCYSYHSGKYVGHAYYGTGAGDTRGELSGTKYRPVGFDRCEPEACAPYSAEACKQAATAAGLELGGEGFSFHGSFKTKGCYSYRSGKYEGHAYYGLGAGDTQGELSGAKYRPVGFDRCENPSIEPEISVGIFGFSTMYEAFVRTGTSCGAKANSASKGFVFRGHRLLCEDFESSSASLLQFP